MRYFVYLFLLILCCNSCSKEYTPPPKREQFLPVILGEISPNKRISVVLNNAKNITSPENENRAIFSNVVLLDSTSNLLSTFNQKENNRWESDFQVEAKKNYSLQFKYDGKTIKATTRIPSPFSCEILEKSLPSHDTLQIKVSIKKSNPMEKASYVVECWQRDNSGYTKLAFTNNDTFTDNYKYRELRPPFKRLFFKISQSKHFSINILREFYTPPTKDKSIEIRIKSLSTHYYDYLYNYELQLQDDGFYLPNNNNGYLGIWGGCYTVVLQV